MAGRPQSADKAENRTRRVTLVMPPAVYDGLNAISQMAGTSVNDFVVGVIERLIRQNETNIAEFIRARDKARANLNVDT